MVDIVDKALRMGEGHQLKKLENVAKAVNALEDEISALSDEDLKAQTPKFKQQIENGKSLDDIMPEAFATVREVSKRTLGQRHFDVQLMGGAALHWGNIAEMKTGEGKTLVATLPTYLNASRQRRARGHRQRLPRQLPERADGPYLPLPRHERRLHYHRPEAAGTPQAVQRRHHLRHQQRVRLRLPARQHGLGEGRPRAARPPLRHRR